MSRANAQTPPDAVPESVVDTAERHRRWLRRVCWTGGLLAIASFLVVIGHSLYVPWKLQQNDWKLTNGFYVVPPKPNWKPEFAHPSRASVENVKRVQGNGPVTKSDIALMRHLPNLKRLWIQQPFYPISNDVLAEISRLHQFEELFLQQVELDGGALRTLSACPSLRHLSLTHTSLSDDELTHLPDFGRLTGLNLFQTGSAGLEHVARCSELEGLNLDQARITDADVPLLARLPKLRILGLHRTVLTDHGARTLVNSCRDLTILTISGNNLTDAVLPDIASLPALQRLVLMDQPITDDGLRELKKCTTLEFLAVQNTKVTAAGIAELQRSNPKLREVQHFTR